MPGQPFQVLAGTAAQQPGQPRQPVSRGSLQLVPNLPALPAKQLVLPGLSLRKETVLSVGMYDLKYDSFLKLLRTYGIRRILDTRCVCDFGHRGFPSLGEFEKEMGSLQIAYERQDSPIVELPTGPDGSLRSERTDNEIWSLVNRDFPYSAIIPDDVQLARYADKLLHERVGLELLRSRIAQGPLLLFGESELPPKRTEQDVLVDTLRVAFPDFAFDLVVYPRDNQWFPWMERGESPTAK